VVRVSIFGGATSSSFEGDHSREDHQIVIAVLILPVCSADMSEVAVNVTRASLTRNLFVHEQPPPTFRIGHHLQGVALRQAGCQGPGERR
jgi:hypothetical protein